MAQEKTTTAAEAVKAATTPDGETGSCKPKRMMTVEERLALRAKNDAKSDAEWEAERRAKDARRAQRIRNEAMGERFALRTFETFNAAGRDDTVREAYELCRDYAAAAYKRLTEEGRFRGERVSILMTGGYGTGKTHLAAAIANRFLDADTPVCFATWRGHLDALQAEFKSDNKWYFDWMAKAPLLVIDDITEYTDGNWSQATLLEAVNRRYEAHLPVVVTTNLTVAELGKFNPRLCDRLKEMATILDMQDGSYREIIARN